MKNIKINLSKDSVYTEPMHNILGINNIPRIHSYAINLRETEEFSKFNFKYIRFHDAPLENPGQQLVDISRIFPLFHADETKAENYFFLQTDDYMRSIENSDAEIDFRVGETIDHSENGRLIGCPPDIDKWARICRNIIAHYKIGEMDGMHLNIKRVSVLEEPEFHRLFGGSAEEYSEMFCKLYKLLKKDFPDIKLVGPNVGYNDKGLAFFETFLKICKENGVTPDNLSFTRYARSIPELVGTIYEHKTIADKYGFGDIKYIFSEYHYGVVSWERVRNWSETGFRSTESAAYSVSGLIAMINTELVEIAYHYAWATGIWSLFDVYAEVQDPMPIYYGLLYFQKLGAECCERLYCETDNNSDAHILCGKTKDGQARLLISCLDCDDTTVRIYADAVKTAKLTVISDDNGDHQNCVSEKLLESVDGKFEFAHNSKHAIYYLEFVS